MMPKIYADFQNADIEGRVRLNCNGTLKDIAREKLELSHGLALVLCSDDADANGNADELRAIGIVEYSTDEKIWVARVDPTTLHHASEDQGINRVRHAG